MRHHTITASDGLRLAVTEQGPVGAPTLVLVHGYPDTSAVWDAVADRLATDFRVLRYDVRGAGASERPARRAGYRIEQLSRDLESVLDACSPEEAVHLVGHDWGAIQSWESVCSPRMGERIASFTSVAGPSLQHSSAQLRTWLRQRRLVPVLRQLGKSWYLLAFQVPVLPGLLWRHALGRAWPSLLRSIAEAPPEHSFAPTLPQDASSGVELYRVNLLGRAARQRQPHTQVPVQLVIPTRDRFISPDLFDQVHRYVPHLWRREVAATHWVPLVQPELLAGWIAGFVEYVGGGPLPEGLVAAG